MDRDLLRQEKEENILVPYPYGWYFHRFAVTARRRVNIKPRKVLGLEAGLVISPPNKNKEVGKEEKMLYSTRMIRELIEKARLTDEELLSINNAMPSEAKYGDVFKAIREAQLDKILEQFPEKKVNET